VTSTSKSQCRLVVPVSILWHFSSLTNNNMNLYKIDRHFSRVHSIPFRPVITSGSILVGDDRRIGSPESGFRMDSHAVKPSNVVEADKVRWSHQVFRPSLAFSSSVASSLNASGFRCRESPALKLCKKERPKPNSHFN
jgi:hypothetical protein